MKMISDMQQEVRWRKARVERAGCLAAKGALQPKVPLGKIITTVY